MQMIKSDLLFSLERENFNNKKRKQVNYWKKLDLYEFAESS